MSRQIVKQPNGKFCIFSSIVDSITYYNLEEKDIIELWVSESQEEIEKKVKDQILQLDECSRYDEMLETIKRVHGSKESKKMQRLIEG